MSKEKFFQLLAGATQKFRARNAEPPRELLDRPNGVVYPVFEREDTHIPDFSAMAGMGHSPQGAMALQLGEEAMQQYGAPAGPEADAPGTAPMADPMAMMTGGGPQPDAQQPGLFPATPPGEQN